MGQPAYTLELSRLVTRVREGKTPLSACLAEAIPLAQQAEDLFLENLCRKELAGWTAQQLRECPADDLPVHRLVPLFASATCLNLTGFPGAESALDYVRAHEEEFIPTAHIYLASLPQIEAVLNSPCERPDPDSLILLTVTARPRTLAARARHTSEEPNFFYATGEIFEDLVASIRDEFLKRLGYLLPAGA